MSQKEKLIARLLTRPRNFTWNELARLLSALGYKEIKKGKTGGSRRRFEHRERPSINLHKPHPGNELKAYQVHELIEFFKREHLL